MRSTPAAAALMLSLFGACARRPAATATMPADGAAASAEGGVNQADADRPGPPPSAEACRPISGTRLRARWVRSSDGAQVFAGWHDRQLDLPCRFQRASDGATYCLPTGAYATEVFSDALCTQPAAALARCASVPFLRRAGGVSPCGDRVTFQALGEVLPTRTGFHRMSDLGCAPNIGELELRALGPMVDLATTFVPAREESGLAGRITVPVLVGADGSRQPCGDGAAELYDRERGEWCRPRPTDEKEPKERCLPADTAREGQPLYRDDRCRNLRYVSASGEGCRDPAYIVTARRSNPLSDLCATLGPPRYSVQRVRAAEGTSWTYGNGCVPATSLVSGTKLWDPGEYVEDAAFAEGVAVTVPEAARLRARYLEFPGGHRSFRGDFEDSRLMISCTPALASDGVLRCLPRPPATVSRVPFYRDAACTQPAAAVFLDNCDTSKLLVTEDASSCAPQRRVWPITGQPSSPLYVKEGTACRTAAGGTTTRIVELGAELPPGEFAPLEEVVE